MELKEFVSESLKQIVEGIADAQTAIGDKARINPQWERASKSNADDMVECRTGRRVEEIQFDVAVTAHDGTATKGGIGVMGGIIALGSQGQISTGITSEILRQSLLSETAAASLKPNGCYESRFKLGHYPAVLHVRGRGGGRSLCGIG
jgi:hypothetical protein